MPKCIWILNWNVCRKKFKRAIQKKLIQKEKNDLSITKLDWSVWLA